VPQGIFTRSVKNFSDDDITVIGDLVSKVQTQLSAKLAELKPRPTGISIEFGIDAEGEVGIPFVTKGSLGANFTVTLEWK
jgi:hypothetical protein